MINTTFQWYQFLKDVFVPLGYPTGLCSLILPASDHGFPTPKGQTKIIFLCVGLSRYNKKRMKGRHMIQEKLKSY